jgi:AcrR family transcriptional regulator
MGRPANADAAETRRNILTQALRLFGQGGLAGTTVRQVADAVGVTFAAVHHHFGTKEQLFAACMDQAFADLSQIGSEIAEAVMRAPAGGAIEAAVRCAFRSALERPDRSRFLLRLFVYEDSAEVRKRIGEAQRGLLARAEALLPNPHPFGRRIPLVGLGVLITRLSVSHASERELFANEVGEDASAIEDYLVHVAEQTLQLKNPGSPATNDSPR